MMERTHAARGVYYALFFGVLGLLPAFEAAAQNQDFDFGDARHGTYILPPGTTTIQQLWSDITGNAQGGYDPSNDNQIPQFENFTISNGATLTTDAFHGDPNQPVDQSLGGVIRFKVKGTLTVEAAGRIDASGKGYQGGVSAAQLAAGAGQQGDSWGSIGTTATQNNRGGGGGGRGEQILGNQQPQSGAGGGHAAAGDRGDPQLGGISIGGQSFDQVAAQLGATFSNSFPFPRFGSGGGAGGFANNFANALALGGNGGGVIFIEAKLIINSGAMRGDGAAGGSALSGGGGGAGGSLLVRTLSDLNGVTSVAGGAGGVGSWNPDSKGGAGSPGIRVWEQRFIIEKFIVGNGSIVLSPNQEQYGEGDIVSVRAVPDPGWRFVRFELDLTTSQNPTDLEIDGPKKVRAVFEEPPVISLLPDAPSVGPAAQQINFQVANTGGGTLHWIASVQNDTQGFVTIASQTPNENALGNGHFIVQVATNPNRTSRQATILVQGSDPDTAPQTATITQLAASPELRVSPAVTNISGRPGTATISVVNAGTGDMPWTARITSPGTFATISSGTSGVNTGSIVVSLIGNPDNAARTVTVEVDANGVTGSPQTVQVVQAGGEPLLQVTPQSQTVDSQSQLINFLVANTGNGQMGWTSTVVTGGDFLSVADGATGTNSGVISVQVAQNSTNTPRTGTIRVDAPLATNTPILLTITQQARDRVLILSTNSLSAPASGGPLTFGVQNGGIGAMSWNATVQSGNEFMSIAGGTGSGTNTGVVNLTILENPRNQIRSGTVIVSAPGADNSPQVVTVTQAAQNIVLSVTPPEVTVGPKGGPVTFTVSNSGLGTMTWSSAVQSGGDFLTLTSGATGVNTGVIGLLVAENTTGNERIGTVLVNAPDATNNPVTVTVRQPASDNVLQVSPQTINLSSPGGPLTFTVQNGGTGNMKWTAVVETGADFITITAGTGAGTNTGIVGLTVQENTTSSARTGTISVSAPGVANSPQIVTINQAARQAILQVSPTELSVGAIGGPLTFNVSNAGIGTMNWTASVQTGGDFVTIENNPTTGQTSGVGVNNGTVRLRVLENTTNDVRTSEVIVGALGAANSPVTVTVTQAPRNAVLAVNPDDLSIGSIGGPLSFTVQNAGTGTMTWSAAVQTGSEFLSIVSGTGVGTNTGTVSLSVLVNTTGLARSGSVLVSAPGATNSPRTITITQSGGNNVLQVTPTSLNVGAGVNDTSFSVKNAGTGSMNWIASVQSGADFVSLVSSSASGTNSGSVQVHITQNNADTERVATVLVEAPGADNSPATVTITQSARAAVLLVNPTQLNADPAGGPLSFSVDNTGTGSMNWAASVQSGADFVRIANNGSGLSSGFGTNSGTVQLTVLENTTEDTRVATIQVQAVGASNSPETVTVTQGPRNLLLQIAPANRVVSAAAGTVNFSVNNAGSGTMNWTASIQDGADFLSLASGSGSGLNAGTISLAVTENRSGATRIGTLRVDAPGAQGSPGLVTVTQLAENLVLDVSPHDQSVSSDGGTVNFAVSNVGSGSMIWTAAIVDGATFTTLGSSSTTGTNTGVIVVTLAPNRSGTPRTARIVVEADGAEGSPVTITVAQDAVNSVLRVTPVEQIIGARAGSATFQVDNAGSGTMNWVASVQTGANFVSISTGGSGTNTGAITVTVDENTGTLDRDATIMVQAPNAANSPTTLHIAQRARGTALNVTPANQSIGSLGGVVSFSVENSGAGALNWTASITEGASFASITSAASGVGPGALLVTITPNNDREPRIARLTVQAAGASGSPFNVTVTQDLCKVLRAPDGLSASDGTLDKSVELHWSEVTTATRYEIYRSDTNNASTAALVGSVDGSTTRVFQDLTALPSTYVQTAFGCMGPAQYSFTPRRYYYWVAAVNSCGTGAFSNADGGYRGVKLSNGIIIAEKALPPAQPGGTARIASPAAALSIRLQSEAGIDPASVWAEVHADGTKAQPPQWTAISEGDTDGWVSVAPVDAWNAGDVVSVTAGATALDGNAAGPVTFVFEIDAALEKTTPIVQPQEDGYAAVREIAISAGGPDGGVGSAYLVDPGAASGTHAWLPLPQGVDANAASIYAYIADLETAGWYPIESVAGLGDGNGVQVLNAGGVTWLGVGVRHGAVLQIADLTRMQNAAAGVLPIAPVEPGALVVMLVFGAALLLSATRWRTRNT